MIKTYLHKGLEELFNTRKSAKVNAQFHSKLRRMMTVLNSAAGPADLASFPPAYETHPLKGFTPTRYACSVNGPWRLTFQFDGQDIVKVNLEQYH
jgi:proteic killer suppression protein